MEPRDGPQDHPQYDSPVDPDPQGGTLEDRLWDVLIVGGSVAGLSAALVLGRVRRSVLVVDSGAPCNRMSAASHGFFTRDGVAPAALLATGRAQLAAYPHVKVVAGRVIVLRPGRQGYGAALADERICVARKVLLATGVRDQLPPLTGIEQFWGRSVLHCPYCDGWEVRDRPLAVYAQGEDALHLTKLVRALSADVVLCTGGPGRVAEADAQWLSRHGVQMVDVPVRRLLGDGDRLHTIEFVNGTVLARDALFVQTTRTQPGDLWRQIGCRLDANGILPVDAEGRTAVAGLFAAGDLVSYARQITLAVTSGTAAAFGIHGELVEEEFR